jgi:hypothetical protein
MINCVEMKLGALYLKPFLPKIVGEIGVTIINNKMRHVVKLEDLIRENLGLNGGCKWVLKSTEMSILGKTINNHHDDFFIVLFR